IRICTSVTGDRLAVTVADDGDGVPVEDAKNIFLPYRRSSTTHHAASVGLGLWISRALAQAMGGTLDYGRADGWTEFTLTIGLHDDTNPPPGGQRGRSRLGPWRRNVEPSSLPEVAGR